MKMIIAGILRPAKLDSEGNDIPPLVQPNKDVPRSPLAFGILMILLFLVGTAIIMGIFTFYDKYFGPPEYIPDNNLTIPIKGNKNGVVEPKIPEVGLIPPDAGWSCFVTAPDVVEEDAGTGYVDTTFCQSDAVASVETGPLRINCNNPTYQTNDCWEFWSLYSVECNNYGASGWAGFFDGDWVTDLKWATGGQLIDTGISSDVAGSASSDCDDDCDDAETTPDCSIYTYVRCGYCGLPYKAESIKGTANFDSKGVVTATETVSLMEQGSNEGSPQIYRKTLLENNLQAQMVPNPGYLSAHQLLQYFKGTTAYGTSYADHSTTWEALCLNQNLCANTGYWDNYTGVGPYVDDRFTDNKCSITCSDSLSVATINDTLDNHYPVLIVADWDSVEITLSGNTYPSLSWRGAFNDDMLVVVVGYDNDSYYVYHPFNQKQNWSIVNFTSYYKGSGCYVDNCYFDTDVTADISVYTYSFSNVTPSGIMETGGVFEPNGGCTCWDYDNDGNYESHPRDTCYNELEGSDCCDYCPGISGSYGGNEITDDWNTPYPIQKNVSSTESPAATIIAYSIGDTPALFIETDITIQWLNPLLTIDAQYAAGDYDDDVNDDGKTTLNNVIGVNISASTSTGDNDFTKIWGACWNHSRDDTGATVSTFCISNYTSADGYTVVPANWCAAACPGYTHYDLEWDTIINATSSIVVNTTSNITIYTVMAGTAQVSWHKHGGIGYQFVKAIVVPSFDSVIVGGSNITDWNPPLTEPIIFNMNNTIFNEDYIQWIAVDYDDDDDVDRCYGRDLTYSIHCEHNATFLDADFGSYWSDNQTSADNLQLFSITITADSLADANVKKNVSVKMATELNISNWVKQEYKFQSATLIADLKLVDSDTGTWNTDYGDTIWYNLNGTQFNRYNSSFINIEEVNISATDCYDNVLTKALCIVLGFLQLPDDWCYCIVESTSRRNWNHSPILGVCYDYTDDGTFDKCFSSYIADENYWTGFSMEDADKCDIQCDYAEHPELENWYLNYSLTGVSTGTEILEGYMCNIYENCDNDLQSYSFIPPDYYSSCYFTEDSYTQTTYTFDSATTHKEDAATYLGINYSIGVANSSTVNPYFPIQYKLYSRYIHQKSPWQELSRTVICDSTDTSVCTAICGAISPNWCDSKTGLAWDTSIQDVYYADNVVITYFVTIGYDWGQTPDKSQMTECIIGIFGPTISACIAASPYDDDIDDDFKIFMNTTTTNATIGFNPNCTTIVDPSYNFSINISNATGIADSNLAKSLNYSPLGGIATGACWDITGDEVWDAYAGYLNCSTVVEGGGVGSNISAYCSNAIINWSNDWSEIYNITKNDTYNVTVTVKIFDRCAATTENSSQTAYWDRGTTPLLCFNGVRDDENNELIGSGSTSISDYGGTCGLCTDKVLNNDESKASYYDTGFDYGGKWCGFCDLDEKKDEIWIEAVKEYGLVVPFDEELCDEIRGIIIITSIIMMIIMLILLAGLLFLLILIGIPFIVMVTKGVVFTVTFIRRLRGIAKKRKIGRKLLQTLRRVRRNKR